MERKPLGPLFVGDAKVVVGHGGKQYGAFHSWEVAHAWARDAFTISELQEPWAVPAEERKS
jgi:hypothetical protein